HRVSSGWSPPELRARSGDRANPRRHRVIADRRIAGGRGSVRGLDRLPGGGALPRQPAQQPPGVGGSAPRGRGTGLSPVRRYGDLAPDPRELRQPNPVHQFGAQVLYTLTRVFPTLRNNLGALGTLVAMGLILLVLIVIVSIWRRTVVARAA